MTKISIVSAYYGKELETMLFLNNLKDKLPKNYELILVNANSKPIEHEIITKRIDLKENIGFANSINNGIKEATGNYVIIMGNDVFPIKKNWINKLINFQKKHGSWLVSSNNNLGSYQQHKKRFIKTYENYSSTMFFPAIVWLLPRKTIEKIGYFDEQFLIGCYEDNDYCLRIIKNYGTIHILKEIMFIHNSSMTFNQFNTGKYIKENKEKFEKKWCNKNE